MNADLACILQAHQRFHQPMIGRRGLGESLDHQPGSAIALPAGSEHPPGNADRADVGAGGQQVIERQPGIEHQELVGIREQAPFDVIAQAAERVVVGAVLPGRAVLPIHGIDDAGLRERRENPGRAVVALVVIDRDLLEAEDTMMRDPLDEIRRLAAYDRGQAELRLGRPESVPFALCHAGLDGGIERGGADPPSAP